MIALHGDWYVGEYFSYIHIWGGNTVHLLPRIVMDRMVLQETAYHMVVDGAFPKLATWKRKCWPKFPLRLGFLTMQISTDVAILGKSIVEMNLGEVRRRMHDPKSWMADNFE